MEQSTNKQHELVKALNVVFPHNLEGGSRVHKRARHHRENHKRCTLPVYVVVRADAHCQENDSSQYEKDPVVLRGVTMVIYLFV